MDQTIWNFIFIGITFGVYIGIAIWSRAGSTKEYYTAGGGVSPFANGMATAADWMSAATFISMAGGIAAAGYGASKFLMGWTGGFVLLTTLMVPYLRKFGKATVPDFIGDRFYSNGARLVAVICAIFICMTYIMGQMRGVGIVFSRLFDIEIWMGVMIGGGIVFFYAGLGRDERNYLHSGRSILRDGILVHDSRGFYINDSYRQCDSPTRTDWKLYQRWYRKRRSINC